MPDCVFCKIVKKEIPADIVYEDNDFLAFLDIHPKSPGQTLVIPKKHHRWVWDVGTDGSPSIGSYFEIAAKIAHALKKVFNQELIRGMVFGEEVAHAHISLFPNQGTPGDPNDFEGNKKKIIEALNS
jgi:histidine triad (HIT) family protein